MKRFMLLVGASLVLSLSVQAQVVQPSLTNLISDIRTSEIFTNKTPVIDGFLPAGDVFPEFPAIAINKVATDLVIDNEPCSVYLSFDGGKTFLYLTTFYENRRWRIYKEFPDLQVMALKVGTEPTPK